MIASGVWAGAYPLSVAHSLLSVSDGPDSTITQKSELERIGYLGSLPTSYKSNPIGAHFDLHIEQGAILEKSRGKIGAVEGVQAYKWFTVTVRGADSHTGTTDFENRADALLSAAKMILHSHNRASEYGCLASTGILTLKPGSTNTVPGFTRFSLDIRSKEDAKLYQLENVLKDEFSRIAGGEEIGGFNTLGTRGRGCSVEWVLDSITPATKFHDDCIRCVEDAARDMLGTSGEGKVRRMTSGAGHDR
jgi:acetylornithine deacetylase/succinyl-diaminopimelate desuccinylase-like protein